MHRYTQEQLEEAMALVEDGLSQRSAAIITGVPRSTLGDKIREVNELKSLADTSKEGPVITFLDVETSATISAHFTRFKAFISPEAVIQEPYLLTCAWKNNRGDSGAHSIHHYPLWEQDHTNDLMLVEQMWDVLDQSDIIVAHNASFDENWFNNRFAAHGMHPPSTYKVICTLKALKKYFKLPSNSLDASTRYFELEQKRSHEGIGLWLRCMQGDVDALESMLEYNLGDIPTLEQLYYKILPFIKNHPNAALYYNDDKVRCNTCGADDMEEITGKYSYTNLSKFKTFRCNSCGSVKRNRVNERSKEQMKSTLMNTV